jgi:hypothetical protein
MINLTVFRKLVRIFFSFRIERLSANINWTFHKVHTERLITYARFALEISVDCWFFRPDRLQGMFSTRLATFQRTQHFFAIGMLLSKFRTCVISLQSYASNKQNLLEMATVIRHGVAQTRKYEVTLLTVQVSVVFVKLSNSMRNILF